MIVAQAARPAWQRKLCQVSGPSELARPAIECFIEVLVQLRFRAGNFIFQLSNLAERGHHLWTQFLGQIFLQ